MLCVVIVTKTDDEKYTLISIRFSVDLNFFISACEYKVTVVLMVIFS